MSNGSIQVTIEWKARASSGVRPGGSIFTNDVIKDKCPRLLVDFYESRINAKSRTSTDTNMQTTVS